MYIQQICIYEYIYIHIRAHTHTHTLAHTYMYEWDLISSNNLSNDLI